MIRQVNGQTITSVGQLRAVLAQGGRQWRITVERNGQQIEAAFNL
jgi:hypothetical protein